MKNFIALFFILYFVSSFGQNSTEEDLSFQWCESKYEKTNFDVLKTSDLLSLTEENQFNTDYNFSFNGKEINRKKYFDYHFAVDYYFNEAKIQRMLNPNSNYVGQNLTTKYISCPPISLFEIDLKSPLGIETTLGLF
ncbi:hypothetical protein [Mesonia maritima]|uniref:Uncharacterized protein n=1 Tax=Mesonia maritima TaxID=1793873 RepID=A0ABU1K9Z4_9FLAO|nr:hypothetical protein [Mesonia maritima]MDR6301408.1 hypothetical protein [Mesonia maritima]